MPRWQRLAAIGTAPVVPSDTTGRGIVGLIGSGTRELLGNKTGYATMGLVGSGVMETTGGTTSTDSGYGTVGLVGAGASQLTAQETGYAAVGLFGAGATQMEGDEMFDAYALLRDEKTANTAGGGFTSGAWQTRTLNTEVSDVAGIVTLSANQFELQAGTYLIHASAPAHACSRHKTKLVNVTDTTDALIGSSEYCHAANGGSNRSFIIGDITIAGAKTFAVQHRCETTRSSDGMGVQSNFSLTEVYAVVQIWRYV